jgi:hypothetical protein
MCLLIMRPVIIYCCCFYSFPFKNLLVSNLRPKKDRSRLGTLKSHSGLPSETKKKTKRRLIRDQKETELRLVSSCARRRAMLDILPTNSNIGAAGKSPTTGGWLLPLWLAGPIAIHKSEKRTSSKSEKSRLKKLVLLYCSLPSCWIILISAGY